MDITMPQLGETVTEGTVTRWLKQVGDEVAPDELIFEVSTDKVDSEVPSPAGGFLAEILVPEGETVPVGTRLAVLSDSPPAEAAEGGGDGARAAGATAEAPPAEEAPAAEAPAAEAPEEAEEAPAAEAPAKEAPEEAEEAPAAEAPAAEAPAEEAPEEAEEPAAEAALEPARAEEEAGARAEAAEGKGVSAPPAAQAAPEPAAPAAPEPAAPAAPEGDGATGGMLLSPVVRRLVGEHGLDPADIPGTGEGGRVTRSDVLAYIDRRGGAARPAAAEAAAPAPAPARAPEAPAPAPEAPAPAPAPAPAAAAARAPLAGGDETIPFDNIRRRTAEHMVRSKQTSAHVLTAVDVDFEAIERVRSAHKAEWRQKEGFALTYLPFIARATCDAISDFPHVNASVGEDTLVVHHFVNLGIAVDLEFKGLIVPVVKQAEGKRLRQLAREIRDLAERARTKKLSPDDVTGGTFTVTNPGPFGTLISAPVINQPQVAILSTEGVRKRPVVVEDPAGDDAIAIHHVGLVAMSWDHRAIDGAYAAAFLNRLREIIETRDWGAELA